LTSPGCGHIIESEIEIGRTSRVSQETRIHPLESFEKASRLGPSVVIQGELSAAEDLFIQGQVKGKIDFPHSDILIDEQGRVEAEIHVRNIIIRGEVHGNIAASGKITIEKSGRMRGDIAASVISIEDGAQFRGSIKIRGKT